MLGDLGGFFSALPKSAKRSLVSMFQFLPKGSVFMVNFMCRGRLKTTFTARKSIPIPKIHHKENTSYPALFYQGGRFCILAVRHLEFGEAWQFTQVFKAEIHQEGFGSGKENRPSGASFLPTSAIRPLSNSVAMGLSEETPRISSISALVIGCR